MIKSASYFHLHLVSDATGETLLTVGRAAAAQYVHARAVEHVHPLVRTNQQLDRIIADIEDKPGIVLYTLVDNDLAQRLEKSCQEMSVPAVSVLDPVLTVFQSYLGAKSSKKSGAQYVLDAEYFRRIDALNFTLVHDDGQLPEDISSADIVIVGISRTSKTPTSIYLANRGYKTTNLPLVPGIEVPQRVIAASEPLIVGLIASAGHVAQIRQNRLLSLKADTDDSPYVDRATIAAEIAYTRKLCARNGWPIIDVTRKSIEETAAGILSFYRDHQDARKKQAELARQTAFKPD